MTKTIPDILYESLIGSLGIIKSLVIIIIPLMVAIQIMTEYRLLEKLSTRTKFITDFIGVSKDTLIAMLIGIFAGISYGAGAIIDAKERYSLSKKDIFLVMCLIVPFHSVIEVTLIFWVIGVNPAIVLVTRLAVAVTATLFIKTVVVNRMKDLDAESGR